MRKLFAVLPLIAVAACSGGEAETVGSNAPPAGAGSGTSGGTGTGVSPGTGAGEAPAGSHFLSYTGEKTFDAVGGLQSLVRGENGGTLYQGNASTVRSPSGQISYNSRDGIFTLTLADDKAGVNTEYRFQDPAHRTDFDPMTTPQWGVPDLQGFNYLEGVGDSTRDVTTFFYQRPGASTVHVSLAGYVRNNVTDSTTTFERGAMVFGSQTARSQVPVSGKGTYTGGFIASMVANGSYDLEQAKASALQWMQGSSTVAVDFAKGTVQLGLSGTVNQANMSGYQIPDSGLTIPTGATFTASGHATIDMVATGGFTGRFDSASFSSAGAGTQTIDFAGVSSGSNTAGASSIDGGFYGPNAVNVGGSFRIVGGIPDQRVDILGAFTGAKRPN